MMINRLEKGPLVAATLAIAVLYAVPAAADPTPECNVGVGAQSTECGVDAAAGGASDGLTLAVNVAAMLIAFLAFIAMFDFLLGVIRPGLTLASIFGVAFSPLAFLMGVPPADVGPLADLLGTKLIANEFVAFVKLTGEYKGVLSERSYVLATFALTGFANIASVGIQLGGIGAMAPARRGDLAQLGTRALLAGFLATLINASLAGMLLDVSEE